MHPLPRLMLPLYWRFPFMDYGTVKNQDAIDQMTNKHRYDNEPESTAAIDHAAVNAIRYLIPQDTYRILDIGAGHGTYTMMLPGKIRFANEPVDSLWKIIQKKDPSISRVGGDAYNLQIGSCLFDVVTVFHTLHHICDRPRVFEEIRRVLVPGGRLVLVEPRHTWRRAARLAKVWFTEYRKTKNDSRYQTHDFCTWAEILSLCRKVGLDVIQCHDVKGRVIVAAEKGYASEKLSIGKLEKSKYWYE